MTTMAETFSALSAEHQERYTEALTPEQFKTLCEQLEHRHFELELALLLAEEAERRPKKEDD